MQDLVNLIRWMLLGLFRSKTSLEAEILALRHQLNVLRRTSPRRPVFSNFDRMIFVCLYRIAPRILDALTLWGAPRIHGELLKLGIDVGQTSVAKYIARRRRPPSQGWRTFLLNHADGFASIDLFVVPTISFKLLYGLLILRHDRRRILWIGVTTSPTAEWVARQVSEACGWEPVPDYLVRDRDRVYGEAFTRRLRAMGIRDRPTALRSPWQNGYAERLIGSIRRECLDHVIVFGERHLRHVLRSYQQYYNGTRTHRALAKDSPLTRSVQAIGSILPLPILGGLHHHYVRI
jgi:transposase InsO family protein